MKKYCLLLTLLITGASSFAQSLDDITKLMNAGQAKKSKEAIDKFLSDPKNATKADAYFYKGKIYNAVSKDSSIAATDAIKLKIEAFEAFKKYQELDPKDISFLLENHGSYFDLYNGYFDIGAKAFSKKDFATSFDGFKHAVSIEEFVRGKGYDYNGYKFPVLDTSLILNTAIAANQAKDEASSVIYYRKLADANLAAPQYINIYQYLADYYIRTKDETNLAAILEKGRTLYPQDDYWTDVEIERVSKSGDKQALIAKYDELIKKYPTKYVYAYNLSVELYNEVYMADNRPANAIALQNKLTETLKTAISLDKGVDSKMLMTRHLYNYAYDFQDSSKKIKGAKPDDIKKRNDLKAQFMKKIDECIPYAESAVEYFGAQTGLKPVQKANYKDALDILSQFYNAKGDAKKAAEYDAKKAAVDKM